MSQEVRFHTILTHRNSHQDEGWAILLLRRYGATKYPGIDTAKIEFTDDPQGVDGEALLKLGVICIGCGRGQYDEHGNLGPEQTCAAELVAKSLGVANNRAISNNLAYVKHCDRTADVRQQELPSLIKRWHREHRDNPMLVLERMLQVLEDELNQSLKFQKSFEATRPDKKFFPLLGLPEGAPARTLCYAVFNTDDPNVPTVARIKGVDLVIIKTQRGNVQIFTRSIKTEGGTQIPVADIAEVARIMRMGEMMKRGEDPSRLTEEYLRSGESLPEVPQWYYLQAGQMLLNGSDQAAGAVTPTILSIDDAVQAVKAGCRPFKVWQGAQIAEALQKVAVTVSAGK